MAIDRWWDGETDVASVRARQVIDSLLAESSPRIAHQAECVVRYEGDVGASSLDSWAYAGPAGRDAPRYLRLNLARSTVDTVAAEIAGRDKPVPLLVTTAADWGVQRRARRLQRAVVAQMHLRHGAYADGWECCADAETDALVTGAGFVLVEPSSAEYRVDLLRIRPGDVVVDDAEGYGLGQPRTIAVRRIRTVSDLETLAGEDPALLAVIRDSRGVEASRCASRSELRETWEIWRTGMGGRHMVLLGPVALVDEPHDHPTAPLVRFQWAPRRDSWWGQGLVDETRSIADGVNRTSQRLDRMADICSGRRTYVRTGSLTVEGEQALQSNEDETIIPVLGELGASIQEAVPQPFPPALDNWLTELVNYGYAFSGVSQMAAQAQKDPGVTSGVAMRTVSAIYSKRLSLRAQDYDSTVAVDLSREIIWALRVLADRADAAGEDFVLRYPGTQYLREIRWADGELSDDSYEVRCDVSGGAYDSPGGRLETLSESVAQGVISPETFLQLGRSTLDVDSVSERLSAEREWTEDILEQMLDVEATWDDATASYDYQLAGETWVYEPPEPFYQDLAGTIGQCVAAYWSARRARAPEENLELLRRYIADLEKMMAQRQQAQASMAQPQPPTLGA